MRFHQIYYNDVLNGEGIRTTLFVSGCEHQCKGCYNKSTWSPNGGQVFTKEHEEAILESLLPNHIAGLSLSGGDPLHPANVTDVANLIYNVRERFGDSKNIWMWTGYTLEEIKAEGGSKESVVDWIDVLIDGKFEQDKYDPSLAWRGSSNQKIHRFTNS